MKDLFSANINADMFVNIPSISKVTSGFDGFMLEFRLGKSGTIALACDEKADKKICLPSKKSRNALLRLPGLRQQYEEVDDS